MVTLIKPQVQWMTASPVWESVQSGAAAERGVFRQPMILRFATDNFMDDLLKITTNDPSQLYFWRVTKETWRKPAPIPTPPEPRPLLPPYYRAVSIPAPSHDLNEGEVADMDLKLYQAAHQRFYMVAASLVCRMPGLPDRRLDVAGGERTSFVIRRISSDQSREYAFVDNTWQDVTANPYQTAAGEEVFPLMPMGYRVDHGYMRRMLMGLIPTGNRERYVNAAVEGGQEPDFVDLGLGTAVPRDGREALFRQEVLDPWAEILRYVDKVIGVGNDEGADDYLPGMIRDSLDAIETAHADNGDINVASKLDELKQQVIDARDQMRDASVYVLLDFAYFLHEYLDIDFETLNPAVYVGQSGLLGQLASTDLRWQVDVTVTSITGTTHATLSSLLTGGAVGDSLLEALQVVYGLRDVLDLENDAEVIQPVLNGLAYLLSTADVRTLYEQAAGAVADLVYDALPDPATVTKRTPEVPHAARLVTRARSEDEGVWFAIRCVFDNPLCADYQSQTVSELTQPFQIAAFFDPEAPARPITIPMPIDTSPAGLRKFSKNTAFKLSDSLCGQVGKIRDSISFGDLVLSVLPWPFHKGLDGDKLGGAKCSTGDSNTLGMICSLSIPIVTICAFIILLVFVLLLDTIFKWVPYLLMCFPLPDLDG